MISPLSHEEKKFTFTDTACTPQNMFWSLKSVASTRRCLPRQVCLTVWQNPQTFTHLPIRHFSGVERRHAAATACNLHQRHFHGQFHFWHQDGLPHPHLNRLITEAQLSLKLPLLKWNFKTTPPTPTHPPSFGCSPLQVNYSLLSYSVTVWVTNWG